MLSGRGTLDTGPNLQGLMELAAAVGRAQKGGWGWEGRGGEGEGMNNMIRHIV